MRIAAIERATHTLAKPDNMTDEQCASLPVRLDIQEGFPMFTSAWLPTEQELAALNAGAPVHVSIYGATHPPIYVAVKDIT